MSGLIVSCLSPSNNFSGFALRAQGWAAKWSTGIHCRGLRHRNRLHRHRCPVPRRARRLGRRRATQRCTPVHRRLSTTRYHCLSTHVRPASQGGLPGRQVRHPCRSHLSGTDPAPGRHRAAVVWGRPLRATAAPISAQTYPQVATTAYLASGANYPDALAGAPWRPMPAHRRSLPKRTACRPRPSRR